MDFPNGFEYKIVLVDTLLCIGDQQIVKCQTLSKKIKIYEDERKLKCGTYSKWLFCEKEDQSIEAQFEEAMQNG